MFFSFLAQLYTNHDTQECLMLPTKGRGGAWEKDKEKAGVVSQESLLNVHYNSTLYLQNVKCYIYLDLIVARLSPQIPAHIHSNTYLAEPIILESMCLFCLSSTPLLFT